MCAWQGFNFTDEYKEFCKGVHVSNRLYRDQSAKAQLVCSSNWKTYTYKKQTQVCAIHHDIALRGFSLFQNADISITFSRSCNGVPTNDQQGFSCCSNNKPTCFTHSKHAFDWCSFLLILTTMPDEPEEVHEQMFVFDVTHWPCRWRRQLFSVILDHMYCSNWAGACVRVCVTIVELQLTTNKVSHGVRTTTR